MFWVCDPVRVLDSSWRKVQGLSPREKRSSIYLVIGSLGIRLTVGWWSQVNLSGDEKQYPRDWDGREYKSVHRRVSLECVQNCLAGSIFMIFHGKGGDPGKFNINNSKDFKDF